MEEYGRLIFFAMLLCGFGPIFVIVAYCLLTGRSRWRFSKNQDAESEPVPSTVLRFLGRLYVVLFPVYIILLGLFAYLGLQ